MQIINVLSKLDNQVSLVYCTSNLRINENYRINFHQILWRVARFLCDSCQLHFSA